MQHRLGHSVTGNPADTIPAEACVARSELRETLACILCRAHVYGQALLRKYPQSTEHVAGKLFTTTPDKHIEPT